MTVTRFAYLRVSKSDSTVEQQLTQMEVEGLVFEGDRVYREEGVSGKVPALQRKEFAKLYEAMCKSKNPELCVARIDRLGRDVLDVLSTIETLLDKGVTIRVLGLGVLDKTPSGLLVRNVLLSISQFERELISERTRAKLAHLKSTGVKLGRPSKAADAEKLQKARALFGQGMSWRQVAKELGCALSTLQRLMDIEKEAENAKKHVSGSDALLHYHEPQTDLKR
ncbi:resolvase [Chitinimonas prasina]|uniref:Resolvase n=1 Tax=Chitinimonas prasina TaxID=1434937 RepID=A0ABQ5YJ41_9NEIS|nr:recombinase family protein [Chitinimonas prasina]GLR15006.1 resolvase [Chitinimonas prasina]